MNSRKAPLSAAVVEHQISKGALTIVLLGILFNAVLAAVNARGVRLNAGHVMLTELTIMALACAFIWFKSKRLSDHWRSLLFVYIIVVLFFWAIMLNQNIYIKSVRDMLLIPVFVILGGLAEEKSLIKAMRYLTALLVAVMFVEGWFTSIYVSVFKPAMYYANTRGIQELSTDSSGLFRNSLGFAGRFSFGVFGTHRLSSLLLEQVSLANFSMVLGLFTLSFWEKLRKSDRLLFVGAVLFIILTNNTRTGSIVNFIFLIGYFVFPMLPRRTPLIYAPALIALCFIFFYDPFFHQSMAGDNLQGRIGLTIYKLSELSLQSFFTGQLFYVNSVLDSGYLYLIYSQTGLGFLAFWIYTSSIVPAIDPATKRFANGLSIFIALNLLIGAGIFTIKVAAPLWFIAGFLVKRAAQTTRKGFANVESTARSVRA